MPGGRLTHDERVRIAAGLAEGYGFAEIARLLGRPTSTVTREVARNGGARGYGADRAHRATGHRARRREPAPPEPSEATSAQRRAFVGDFAALLAEAGIPRMVARVLACLFTEDSGSLTAAQLVDLLRVSPASVSKAVAYVEALDLVRRVPDGRRERYVVDDDVWIRAWTANARAHETWADAAARGAALFGTETPTGARLRHMADFFARLGDDMAGGPSDAAVADALTVTAALVHTGPSDAATLATALGWAPERARTALADAERRADLTGPVTVRWLGADRYAATPRLTDEQRVALTAASSSS